MTEEERQREVNEIRYDIFHRPTRTPVLVPVKPLVRSKHVLNPPTATIFGAGIGGLTAAHELIERGFRVVVVEANEDPERPGSCLVGGMAASQYGRVRATVEELHTQLFHANGIEPKTDAVEQWLLFLLLFNRTYWIQTDAPHVIVAASSADDFDIKALAELKETRRKRWLWDLFMRPVLGRMVTSQPPKDHYGHEPAPSSAVTSLEHKDRVIAQIEKLLDRLDTQAENDPNLEKLALDLIRGIVLTDSWSRHREVLDALKADEAGTLKKVTTTLEREFLYVRAIPCWCPLGPSEFVKRGPQRRGFDQTQGDLADKLRDLDNSLQDRLTAANLRQNFDFTRPKTFSPGEAEVCGKKPEDVWFEFEIVEESVPGEHGYRFFPSFYRHLDETLARITLGDPESPAPTTVLDNLKPTMAQGIGMKWNDGVKPGGKGRQPLTHTDDGLPCISPVRIQFGRHRPESMIELQENTIGFVKQLGGTEEDAALLNLKFLQFLTSSSERRRTEYQGKTWAKFIEIDQFSPAMQDQLKAAAQVLNAFSVDEADAYTYGNVAMQLLLDNLADGKRADRTLNGPTTEMWLDPWRRYLEIQGVQFVLGRIEDMVPTNENVSGEARQELRPGVSFGPWAESAGKKSAFNDEQIGILKAAIDTSDFYVLALSAEATHRLVSRLATQCPDFNQRAPDFEKMLEFWARANFHNPDAKNPMRDMVGMQFYFDSKTRVGDGHVYYPYSPWGLSTISQSEFWRRRFRFTDGYMGVLSVDLCSISDSAPSPQADSSEKKPEGFWKTLGNESDKAVSVDRIFDSALPTTKKDDRKSWTGRLGAAVEVWSQLDPRIPAPPDPTASPRPKKHASSAHNADEPQGKAGLEFPRFFHLDRGIAYTSSGWMNRTKFMAVTPETWLARPGLETDGRVRYKLNYDRWLLCGTYAATYTRMTTMEAANESARHAVRAILEALGKDDTRWTAIEVFDVDKNFVYVGRNLTYDGASAARKISLPDVYPVETREPRDLEPLKDLDARLAARGLPHFMDILKVHPLARYAHRVARLAEDGNALARDLGIQILKDTPFSAGEEGKLAPKALDVFWKMIRQTSKEMQAEIKDLPDLEKLLDSLGTLLQAIVKGDKGDKPPPAP